VAAGDFVMRHRTRMSLRFIAGYAAVMFQEERDFTP
jgi:hypothetical protein